MGTLPIIASRQSSLMHILPVEARAIFLGGKKISASDDILSRLSYLELGLRCTVCGEPIYYRSGDVRASHFAHFPELSYIKQEKCERRRRYTSRPQLSPGWYDIDQKQKFALFQKHFFEIIREKLVELPPYYPDSPSLAGIQNVDPVSMDLLLSIRKEREYCEQYIQKCENHYVGLLQIDIAREAFDYLMIISSEGMTLVILQNLISQNKKMFDSLNKVDAPKEIMIMLADTLLTIHWPESFTGYHSTSHSRRQSLIKAKDLNELYRVKVDDGLNSFVCFDRGRFSVESTTEDSVGRVVLGHFDTRELRRKEIERRKISRASVPQAFSVQIDLVSGSDEVKNKIEEHIRRSALEIDIKAPQEGVTVDRSIVDSCERKEVVYEEFKSYKKLVCFKRKLQFCTRIFGLVCQ